MRPARLNPSEQQATAALNGYAPGLQDKLLGRIESKRAELRAAVEEARRRDDLAYGHACTEHDRAMARWKWFHEVARGVCAGDLRAYAAVLEQMSPFHELEELGTAVKVVVPSAWCLDATVAVRDADIIPNEEHTLTASGKLSIKKVPQGKYWELYRAHVCSSALRVGRELLGLLPVQFVIVHVAAPMLNPSTGHQEEQPVLSVGFARETMARLAFDTVDPAAALKNFVHHIDFKKTKGMGVVAPLQVAEFKPAG